MTPVTKPTWAAKRQNDQIANQNPEVYVMQPMRVRTIWEHLNEEVPGWNNEDLYTKEEAVEAGIASFIEGEHQFVQPCLVGHPSKKDRPVFKQDGKQTFHPFKRTESWAKFIDRLITDDGFVEYHNIYVTQPSPEQMPATDQQLEEVVGKFKKSK